MHRCCVCDMNWQRACTVRSTLVVVATLRCCGDHEVLVSFFSPLLLAVIRLFHAIDAALLSVNAKFGISLTARTHRPSGRLLLRLASLKFPSSTTLPSSWALGQEHTDNAEERQLFDQQCVQVTIFHKIITVTGLLFWN